MLKVTRQAVHRQGVRHWAVALKLYGDLGGTAHRPPMVRNQQVKQLYWHNKPAVMDLVLRTAFNDVHELDGNTWRLAIVARGDQLRNDAQVTAREVSMMLKQIDNIMTY